MTAVFGTAGNSDIYTQTISKSSLMAPSWLHGIGLDAYEYQCGNGVHIGQVAANAIRDEALKSNIIISLHSPYYISLTNLENLDKNISYILQSCEAVRNLGGKRIVVHSGSTAGRDREESLQAAKQTLKEIIRTMDAAGYSDIILCPETMGKINQLGTLDEVMELCGLDDRIIPCVDFGHLYARSLGGIEGYEQTEMLFDLMENKLGIERTKSFHSHFSKIEYSGGGEKKHLTFEDRTFGPDFRPVARLVAKRRYHPTFICESSGTQSQDALKMKQTYFEELNNTN